MQDISTTRGINNFLHVSKMLQLNFAKAYEQAGEFILLPFDFEIIGAEDAYVENAKDEFEIIYTYPAEAYTGNQEEIAIDEVVDKITKYVKDNLK